MLLKTYTRKRYIVENDLIDWDDLVIFLEKITSWACLFNSELNEIFRWCAHSAIFNESLFNSHPVVLASLIMEKSDVSSANNLTVDMISIDRLLI